MLSHTTHLLCAGSDFECDIDKASFIVWNCHYVVVDGHHRLHALQALRDENFPGLPILVCAAFQGILFSQQMYQIVGSLLHAGELLCTKAINPIGAVCLLGKSQQHCAQRLRETHYI
jgi:hypothetical protein